MNITEIDFFLIYLMFSWYNHILIVHTTSILNSILLNSVLFKLYALQACVVTDNKVAGSFLLYMGVHD